MSQLCASVIESSRQMDSGCPVRPPPRLETDRQRRDGGGDDGGGERDGSPGAQCLEVTGLVSALAPSVEMAF